MSNPKTCCLCEGPLEVKRTPSGRIYWDDGENAQPVKDGRCCETCNWQVVIPARLTLTLDILEASEEA